jgi:hypothetical protein
MKTVILPSFAFTLAILVAAPSAAAKDAIKVTSGSAIKGAGPVVIGSFNIGFVFESIDNSAATGGLVGAFGGATRAKSQLVGVTPEIMQAITDAAYADFRTQLAAKGFTIVDNAALFGSEKVAKLKPVAVPNVVKVKLDPKKDSNGKATFFKPTGLPNMIVLAGDITGSSIFSAFGQVGAGMDTQMALTEYAKQSGQSIVNVTYVMDFSQLKRPGAFSFGGLEVNSGMSVVGDYSRAVVLTPDYKMATLTMQIPVSVEGDFAQKQDETKDGALQSAANVAGGLAAAYGIPGLSFGKSKTFSFTAKPAYQDGAIKAASLANTVFADQLGALR